MARPREFDVDEAIQIATDLFCEHGYQATSISDLTDALGILRGSLYKVFPDKHSLLLTVLDRYRIAQLDGLQKQLNQADGLRIALLDWAEQSSGLRGRRGCLIAHLAQELIPGDAAVSDRIQRHFQQLGEVLEEALERMQIPPGSIPVLAHVLITTMQGMRVVGKAAPAPAQVREVAETVLALLTNQSSTFKARATAAS
jgi:TetR/AcrR family transcriptional regulator, transcriptional repressor for nem operon